MEIVKIKPEHFINSEGYTWPKSCPLALALNDHFNTKGCDVVIGRACINGKNYNVDESWNSNTRLFNGTLYAGMWVDEVILFAKNHSNPESLPTIEVWVDYKK